MRDLDRIRPSHYAGSTVRRPPKEAARRRIGGGYAVTDRSFRPSRVARWLAVLMAALIIAGTGSFTGMARAGSAHAPFKDSGTVTLVTNGSAADLDGATNELASSDMIVRNIAETLLT